MYNAAISTTHAVTTLAIFFKLCLVIRGYIFLQPRYLLKAVPYTSVGSYVITHPGVMWDPDFVSVKVAVIPGFSDAGGWGQPPRFRTLVTGAHNCNPCGFGIFPALQALHSATTDVP